MPTAIPEPLAQFCRDSFGVDPAPLPDAELQRMLPRIIERMGRQHLRHEEVQKNNARLAQVIVNEASAIPNAGIVRDENLGAVGGSARPENPDANRVFDSAFPFLAE